MVHQQQEGHNQAQTVNAKDAINEKNVWLAGVSTPTRQPVPKVSNVVSNISITGL